ncbi:MAG: hypothetical protein C4297_06805 [Gemmataceae bacterium]
MKLVSAFALVYFGQLRAVAALARKSGLLWLATAALTVGCALCASLRVTGGLAAEDQEVLEFVPSHDREAQRPAHLARHGVEVAQGEWSIGFGFVRMPLGRDARDAVRLVLLLLVGGAADAPGLLLALLWTAGFVPQMLQERHAVQLVSRPWGRAPWLVALYLAVVTLYACFLILFVGCTWLTAGMRTGIFWTGYWLPVPVGVLSFAAFYAFSALFGAGTRSTAAASLATVVFWLICWGASSGWYMLSSLEPGQLSSAARTLCQVTYYLLPKPADQTLALFQALGSHTHLGVPAWMQAGVASFSLGIYVSTTLAFTSVCTCLAALLMRRMEF